MARCSCGNATCSCVIKSEPGGGVVVTGSGSPLRPYLIGLEDDGNQLANLEVVDTPSLNLSMSGAGVPGDKVKISGVSTPKMAELRDVKAGEVPASGDVPIWNGTAWEFSPPPSGGGGGGTVYTGNGIEGDGSIGNPVAAKESGIWGTDPLNLFGADSLIGSAIYVDSAGNLRARGAALPLESHPTTDLHTTYPTGLSVFSVNGTYAAANGWVNSGHAFTVRRPDGSSAVQFWFPFGVSTWARFRASVPGGAWSAWKDLIGTNNPVAARGRGSIVFTNVAAANLAVTFPVGIFTNPPRVSAISAGGSFMMAYTTGSPTTSGVTFGLRQVDGALTTATYSFDWIAIANEAD